MSASKDKPSTWKLAEYESEGSSAPFEVIMPDGTNIKFKNLVDVSKKKLFAAQKLEEPAASEAVLALVVEDEDLALIEDADLSVGQFYAMTSAYFAHQGTTTGGKASSS